jgi:predicted MFS family arabinose efflux permease
MSTLLQMPRFFILMLLVSFAVISAVLFTPGLPELGKEFALSDSELQWTVSIFLAGYCIGQLPYGPIANRIGRKKTIYLGLGVSVLGTLIVLFSSDFMLFCLGRFIQALGSAVGLKVTFTMIGDLHSGSGATKAIGYITVAFALMQGVGVAIGGFIVAHFGWRGCFAALLIYTLVLFFLCTALPETSKGIDRAALRIRSIASGYARQFKDPFIVLHATLMGLASATVYVMSTEAPSIAIDLLGLTPDEYGLFSLIPAFGFGMGLFLAGRIAGKARPRIAMASGILLVLVGALIMSILFFNHLVDAGSLFLPAAITLFGSTFPFVYSSSVGLCDAADKSNASAVMQCINVGFAFLGTFLTGYFGPVDIFTLPSSFVIISAAMLFVWLFLREHHRRKGHA